MWQPYRFLGLCVKETAKPMGDVSAASEPFPDATSPRDRTDPNELLESFKDDDDDPIEVEKSLEALFWARRSPRTSKGL